MASGSSASIDWFKIGVAERADCWGRGAKGGTAPNVGWEEGRLTACCCRHQPCAPWDTACGHKLRVFTCGTSSSGNSLSNFPISSSASWPVTRTSRAGVGPPNASRSKGPAGGGVCEGGVAKVGMSPSPSREISGNADAARSKSISASSRRSAMGLLSTAVGLRWDDKR